MQQPIIEHATATKPKTDEVFAHQLFFQEVHSNKAISTAGFETSNSYEIITNIYIVKIPRSIYVNQNKEKKDKMSFRSVERLCPCLYNIPPFLVDIPR